MLGGALDHPGAGADPAGAAAERGAEVALRQTARERLLRREERVVARAEAGRRIGGGEERAAALERAVGKAERERRGEAVVVQRAIEVVQGRGAVGRAECVIDRSHRVRRRREVCRQEGRLLHRYLGPAGLDRQPDATVKLLAMAGQHRAVCDFAKAGLRERVKPAFNVDHGRCREPAERAVHVDLRAVDRSKQRGVERPPGHRRRVQDPPVGRRDGVDPAQEQLVERVGKRGPFGEVDEGARALALDDDAGRGEQPDGLLRVRRVALGALRDLAVHAAVRHERPHERLGRASVKRSKAELDVLAGRRPRRGELRAIRDDDERA